MRSQLQLYAQNLQPEVSALIRDVVVQRWYESGIPDSVLIHVQTILQAAAPGLTIQLGSHSFAEIACLYLWRIRRHNKSWRHAQTLLDGARWLLSVYSALFHLNGRT